MTKISIIVPVYKVEKYLNKCIESIINQTYKNLEIILVDDGSPDSCSKLCDLWGEKDSRVQVIHQKNKGLSAARNVGLQFVTGDYIGFIDSDDFIHPEMFERMLKEILKVNADLCICGTRWINEDGSLYKNVIQSPIRNELMNQNDAFEKLVWKNGFYYVTAWNKLYKRKIFDEIRFPEGKIHEDEFTIHHIISQCSLIVSIEKELYFYVQRENSIMHNSYSEKHLDGVLALFERYEFFKRIGKKKLSYSTLKQCYGILYEKLQIFDIYKNKNDFEIIVKKVSKELWINLRSIKLLLLYYKKLLRGTVAFEKSKLLLKKIFSIRDYKKGVVILLATPTHGNLGDQAIVYSEYIILHKYFPQKKLIEISDTYYLRFPDLIEQYVLKEDIIIISGGGNMGTLWPQEDDKIQDIICRFSKNRIIVFPQTCYYEPMVDCKERLLNNQKIYAKALDLTIMLRDKLSYIFMEENFPEITIVLVPDIVMALNLPQKGNRREGVLLCLRDDCERVISKEEKKYLKEEIEQIDTKYIETSTVVTCHIDTKNRKKELQKKWDEFSKSSLVITDRLHAMIFSVITKTPCIALDNKSKKVAGAYEWIKELEYIQYAENITQVIHLMHNMIDMDIYESGYNYPLKKIEKVLRE